MRHFQIELLPASMTQQAAYMHILCEQDCDDSVLVTAIQIQLADAMMTRIFLTTSRPALRTSWNTIDEAVMTAVCQ